MKSAPVIVSSILLAILGGCQQGAKDERNTTEVATQDTAPSDVAASVAAGETANEPKKSIIRDDVDIGPTPAPTLEPEHIVVLYPEKGAKPDEAGRAMIDEVLASPAFLAGGPITIWGHSDSRGSDAENLAASRRRAEAARDYLASKGVDAKRVTVIALGEARPIAPNRKLDGSDDPEGRAKNRRVEIEIGIPMPNGAEHPSR